MPVIEGELLTCTESAEECLELASFSCGDKRYMYEETVERLVEHFREGRITGATLRVTREMPSAALVGLSIIELRAGPCIRHRLIPEDEYRDAAYAHVITLSAEYRGGYRCLDGTPVSDIIVMEALRYIRETEGTMPVVQALIEPANELSRDMCFRNGFEQPFVTSPDLLYVRHPDVEVP
ncbi:MAG: hypothetical protein ACRDK4_07015 [Solirubrobacteraceae bacterium]